MMKISLPESIFSDLPRAYLVGGSVRDLVRGVEPLDYDVVVPDEPLGFARLMAARLRGKVVTLGKDRFCVHRVVSKIITVDVTAAKGRDIETDLRRRDFTINAMACDLATGTVIDFLGGMGDLKKRRIKMASVDAFRDDPVRLIRAFRMAATLDFRLDPQTHRAITESASDITKAAGERIWAELALIMACGQSFSVLRSMADAQLLFHLIPELRGLKRCQSSRSNADAFTHTLQAYGALETLFRDPGGSFTTPAIDFIAKMPPHDKVTMKMAILLHDIGKPQARAKDHDGKVHFYGHATRSALISREICRRLRISNRHRNRIETIIRHHQRPFTLFPAGQRSGLGPRAVGRFFRQCADLTPLILIHAAADDLGKGRAAPGQGQERISFFQELFARYVKTALQKKRATLINGHDLMKIFGLRPSPLLGKILRSVEELQLEGTLNHRGQVLKWVAAFLEKGGGD